MLDSPRNKKNDEIIDLVMLARDYWIAECWEKYVPKDIQLLPTDEQFIYIKENKIVISNYKNIWQYFIGDKFYSTLKVEITYGNNIDVEVTDETDIDEKNTTNDNKTIDG